MASGGRCAVVTRFGGPDVFEIQEKPVPEPAPDEVRVKIGAAGVAYAEVKMRHGVYPGAPRLPFTPGFDFFGVIDAVGKDVKKFKAGDPCVGLSFVGAYAEYLTLKTDYVAKAPEGLDPVLGAGIPLNYLTAYQMLERMAKASKGDVILIHGGAGGVGTSLLDLVKDSGLKIYATASAGKHDLVRSYGAIPIDYRSGSFVDILQKQGGADVVFDHIGGKHLKASAKAAKRGGRVICYGFLAAVKDGPQVKRQTLWEMVKLRISSRVKPSFYGILVPLVSQKKYIARDLKMLAEKVASGNLKPNIGMTLPLEQVSHAHQTLESAGVTGKIVLVMNEDIQQTSKI
ncbi:MAG: zinc-binding dehydrogenase [Desulfobacterales bacterium]|nr:zinc-binding dehydrogenase [Desulfobacterales bacterium]